MQIDPRFDLVAAARHALLEAPVDRRKRKRLCLRSRERLLHLASRCRRRCLHARHGGGGFRGWLRFAGSQWLDRAHVARPQRFFFIAQ